MDARHGVAVVAVAVEHAHEYERVAFRYDRASGLRVARGAAWGEEKFALAQGGRFDVLELHLRGFRVQDHDVVGEIERGLEEVLLVAGLRRVVDDQHIGMGPAGEVDRAVGALHRIVGLVVLDQASLAAPRPVVGVRVAVVEGDRARMEGHLQVAGQVEVLLGEGGVVWQRARGRVERMHLHDFAVAVGHARVAGGREAVRFLVDA